MWRRFPWDPQAVSKNLSLSFDLAAIVFDACRCFIVSICHGNRCYHYRRALAITTESLRINWGKPTRGCYSRKWFLLKHCWSSSRHILWSSFDSLIAFTQPPLLSWVLCTHSPHATRHLLALLMYYDRWSNIRSPWWFLIASSFLTCCAVVVFG